jgi:hypothetical protein
VNARVCSTCKLIKRKKNKKISSMNKSCEKKTTTAHNQNILHFDVLYYIKRKKYKRKVVADRAGTNVRK